MNGAHLHLLLNHIPVIGVPLGLLLLAFAFLRRSEEWKRAALWTRGDRALAGSLLLGPASSVLLARTANLGGLIKHPEIQEKAAAADSGSSRPGG